VPASNREHYTGSYKRTALRMRATANADPTSTCWRCKRTLGEIHATRPDARWTVGHLIDGDPQSPLAIECSPCNFSAGARRGNALRKARAATVTPSRRWL